ncbi:MAG: MerR family transcriptional regulator [Novosphingobium sp.]
MRTIGEVAAALGIRQHVLRYWEEQFPTLRPLKRGGGRRYYRPEDVALVATIDRLVHREGYTLRGARLAIAGGKPETAPADSSENAGKFPDVMRQLQSIRAGLANALAADGHLTPFSG